MMLARVTVAAAICALVLGAGAVAQPTTEADMTNKAHKTDWMANGSFGLMVHYLIGPAGETPEQRAAEFNRIVNGFDVDAFIAQFESTGADWLIFTIGQNTGYWAGPNRYLDPLVPGRTSDRDLVLEIAVRVKALGKRFIAYLPSEVSWHGDEIKKAFEWDPADQSRFQRNYQEFIRQYALKLGRLCDGWWFDGCYDWDEFNSKLYDFPAWNAAAKAGNPDALVAYNDGSFCIGKIAPVTPLEDYLSGEVHFLVDGRIALAHGDNVPEYMPDARFVDGVQWHALIPVDSTFEGGAPHSYSDAELFQWVEDCKSVGGAVTINLPIGQDGKVPEASVEQMIRLGRFLAEE